MTKPPEDMNEKTCWFCGLDFEAEGLNPDDYYCYGCHEFICTGCGAPGELCLPWGGHEVDDHGTYCPEEGEEDEDE